jgi:hypothetical protein
VRKYQNDATMATKNNATEINGAMAAKRSWRVGERLRHQERHQRVGGSSEKGLVGARSEWWCGGGIGMAGSVGEAVACIHAIERDCAMCICSKISY